MQEGKNLRLALSEAVEENDVAALKRLIPEAAAQGVEQKELDLARRRRDVPWTSLMLEMGYFHEWCKRE